MGSPTILGIIAGLAASGLSIAGILRRGDPHLVSPAPDLFGAIVVALLVYIAVRRSSHRESATFRRVAGFRTSFVAACICAAIMSVFTWMYFAIPAAALVAFTGVASFVLLLIVGVITTLLAARSNDRLHPSAG